MFIVLARFVTEDGCCKAIRGVGRERYMLGWFWFFVNWFCVFELNKFIKLPDRLPDDPAAGVGTPGQQSCMQKSSNVVGPEDFA